ncbi:MAG: L-ectoine synthase [Rhodobacteraceae bacterium]|nr:L-ectoine synthase [Paracoccaceae bacterium]
MLVRTLDEVMGTPGEAHGPKWHSMRLLLAGDGMGVTLTDLILETGFEMTLQQENHFQACYCLEGTGQVEELENDRVHRIRPGMLYAMNGHDRHRITVTERMRLICTLFPALRGDEVHDPDGGL